MIDGGKKKKISEIVWLFANTKTHAFAHTHVSIVHTVHALTHRSDGELRSPPRACTWINVARAIISFITVLDLFR